MEATTEMLLQPVTMSVGFGDGFPAERPAFASLADILEVERLRLRLRERYPNESAKRLPPWCVSVD